MEGRRLTSLDRLLAGLDGVVRGIAAPSARAARPYPAADVPETTLADDERRQAAALMRVNHAGEVAAQGLYQGHAAVARHAGIAAHLRASADEERDHLAWCEQRLGELKGSPSLLRPAWFGGAWLIGAASGILGDRWSLGFVAETERQVEEHLSGHLERLPAADRRSRYAGPDPPPLRQIARELEVGSIVEASVQVVGDRLRVNVQLVDGATDARLWAERYDRTLDDAFVIQSEIAEHIVAAVGATLDAEFERRLTGTPTPNAHAYRLYLRATELPLGEERASNRAAEELLLQALALDTGFAVARALLAHVYIVRPYNFGDLPRWADSGLVLAQQAVGQDSNLALGYAALGIARLEAGLLTGAQSAFQQELSASPSGAGAMLRLGWVWFLRGRLDEAVRLWANARRLDPANWLIALNLAAAAIAFGDHERAERWLRGAEAGAAQDPYVRQARVWLAHHQGRIGDAVAEAERFLADQPDAFLALEALAETRLWSGQYDPARAHLESMQRLAPEDWNFWGLAHRALYGWTLLKLGDADGGASVLEGVQHDAQRRLAEGDERPGVLREIAAIHAALGDRDRALEWLERAIDAGWRLERLRPSPLFESVRDETGYARLMARMTADLRRSRVEIEERDAWEAPSSTSPPAADRPATGGPIRPRR